MKNIDLDSLLVLDSEENDEDTVNNEAPKEQPPRGVKPQHNCANPPAPASVVSALDVPFKDVPARFWEKTTAFWAVSVLGIVSGGQAIRAGWHNFPLMAGAATVFAVACGLAAGGVALQAKTEGSKQRRGVPAGLALSVGLACMVSFIGIAAVCSVLIAPAWLEAGSISFTIYMLAFSVMVFAAPAVFDAGIRCIPAIAGRFAASWHTMLGATLVAAAYAAFALPIAAATAVAPKTAKACLDGLARAPHLFWLSSLARVCTMVADVVGHFREVSGEGAGRLLSIIARRLKMLAAGFPMMTLGTWYAVAVTMAGVVDEENTQKTGDRQPFSDK